MGGNLIFGAAGAVVVLAGLRAATAVFLPLAVAYFSAVLLEPLVALGDRHGLPRKGGAVLATVLFMAVVAGGIALCSQPFAKLYSDLPKYEDKLRSSAQRLQHKAQKMQQRTQSLTQGQAPPQPGVQKVQVVEGGGVGWSKYALAGLGSLAEALGIAVFVPFFILFMLMEKDLLLTGIERLFSEELDRAHLENETRRMVVGYFIGNLMAALALGALQTGLFMIAGLENPVGLGIVTGFFNVVPILGLPAALLPPVLQAVTQQGGGGSGAVWIVAGGILVLHLFMANFVEPRWIANHVKLNSFVATLAMLFWGWGWGIVGFLLAIPLVAQLRIVLEASPKTARWAAPLAQRPYVARRHGAGFFRRPREPQSTG